MKTKRIFVIISMLVVILGLLTVSVALASQDSAASLVSVTGGSSEATGESISVPELGGTLLFEQLPNQANGLFSDPDCGLCGTGQQSIADNFILSDDYTIENIVFWNGYFSGNSAANEVMTVIFHSDSAGSPGAAISTEANVPASSVQTGVVLFGVNEWMTVITLTNPVALTAGTYWVEIFNDTTGSADSFFWETGNLAGNGIANAAFATAVPGVTWMPLTSVFDMAIQIYGSQPAQPAPGIEVSKTPASQDVVMGGNAYFTITVTNTGNVDLDSVDVSDPLVSDCDNAIGTMVVSATVSYGCTDTGVAASYTNVVTVTSLFGTVPGPTASASADVNVVPPTSVSLSGFGGDSASFSPVLLAVLMAVVVGFGFALRRKLTA